MARKSVHEKSELQVFSSNSMVSYGINSESSRDSYLMEIHIRVVMYSSLSIY